MSVVACVAGSASKFQDLRGSVEPVTCLTHSVGSGWRAQVCCFYPVLTNSQLPNGENVKKVILNLVDRNIRVH